MNPTSMTFDAAGQLYVSSRFEGSVYRVFPDGTHETVRERSRHRVRPRVRSQRRAVCRRSIGNGVRGAARPDRQRDRHAAAERRGVSPRRRPRRLRVRVGADARARTTTCIASDPATGAIDKVYSGFGRPQGIAFDSQGALYVVEALAGWNGLYRVRPDGTSGAGRRGAVARRRGVQSERRPRGDLERHGLPAGCPDPAAWVTFTGSLGKVNSRRQGPAYPVAAEMTASVSRVAPMTAPSGMLASRVARCPPIVFASPSRYTSLIWRCPRIYAGSKILSIGQAKGASAQKT